MSECLPQNLRLSSSRLFREHSYLPHPKHTHTRAHTTQSTQSMEVTETHTPQHHERTMKLTLKKKSNHCKQCAGLAMKKNACCWGFVPIAAVHCTYHNCHPFLTTPGSRIPTSLARQDITPRNITQRYTFFVLSFHRVDTTGGSLTVRCCSPALLLTTAAFSLLAGTSKLRCCCFRRRWTTYKSAGSHKLTLT